MKKSDDQIYIDQLKRNLKQLPLKEYDDAIQYYAEYIADANLTDYAEIVSKLGTPKKLARQLEANYLVSEDNHKNEQNEQKSVNHNLKLIITILLALSSPFLLLLAIPLVIFIGMTIFGLGLGIFFTTFVGGSLLSLGIASVTTKGMIALFIAGIGLALLGLVLTFIGLAYFIGKFMIQKLVVFFKFIYRLYQTKVNENGGLS